MDATDVFALGLGVTPPWRLVEHRLETDKRPHILEIRLEAERGALFPCPDCGKACKAHDFKQFTWRHLNFFQHHCMITAKIPRTVCPEHGVKRMTVPWAREGSGFTLLFEQAALMLVREMPVLAAARIMEVTDKRLWRIIEHYVGKALGELDLKSLKAFALDETASKRGHNYVTVFIDLERQRTPVVFATPGKGKETVKAFKAFLEAHGGKPDRIAEVVCDMSPAFLAAIPENFENATQTVDWFHVVQLFTRAVDAVQGRAQSGEAARGHPLGGAQGAERRQADRQTDCRPRRIGSRRLPHRRSLADQGKAALGAGRRNASGGKVADYPLPPPRP
jgi:transposase